MTALVCVGILIFSATIVLVAAVRRIRLALWRRQTLRRLSVFAREEIARLRADDPNVN